MMLIEVTQIVDEVNEEEVLKGASVTTAPNIPVYNIIISLIVLLLLLSTHPSTTSSLSPVMKLHSSLYRDW